MIRRPRRSTREGPVVQARRLDGTFFGSCLRMNTAKPSSLPMKVTAQPWLSASSLAAAFCYSRDPQFGNALLN